jgi:hypothetical protein
MQGEESQVRWRQAELPSMPKEGRRLSLHEGPETAAGEE